MSVLCGLIRCNSTHPVLVRMGQTFRDLTGQRFGRLVAQESVRRVNGRLGWLCLCDCGNQHTVDQAWSLTSGNTRSCGCLKENCGSRGTRRHKAERHGLTGTSEYNSWVGMVQRCTDPNFKRYADYGGRGIKVCDRWRNSFTAFLADMGLKPEPKRNYSVERDDNDGNYEPTNCYWATRSEQQKNRPYRRARAA
jgi:hypothetical protein